MGPSPAIFRNRESWRPMIQACARSSRVEQEAWAGADAIIAVDSTQSQIVQEQGGDVRKITVIPNAVDMDEVDQTCRALPLVQRDEPRPWIVLARRLEPKNGVEYAIRAPAEFSPDEPRPRLILAGEGEERPPDRAGAGTGC